MEYKISKATFNKETVLKVVYLWQENFTINIAEDDYNWTLNIESKNTSNEVDIDMFNRELQEQQLRETLNKQFGNLRDCIYSKAFQHFQG